MTPRRLPVTPAGFRLVRRSAVGCAAAAALALALGACGSANSHPSAGARSSAGAAVASCGPASLQVTIDTGAAGAAGGSSFVPIDFTNRSHASCGLAGYPAVSFAASAAGGEIGAAAVRDLSVSAHPVVLPPGGTAHAWLQVLDAANYPAGKCHPVTARGLMVDPPGRSGTSYLEQAFLACTAAVHGSDLLTVQPIQPGPARRGTAQ